MAQIFAPELYLSLLSSRDGDLSQEYRGKAAASRQSLPKHPDHLLNVLDALAAICVQNKGDIFFVSLAMTPNSATLCVSANGTVPASPHPSLQNTGPTQETQISCGTRPTYPG